MRSARLTVVGVVMCLVVFGLTVAVPVPADAATLTVPSRDYPTIQSAVDAAEDGDMVKVKKGGGAGPRGEYNEKLDQRLKDQGRIF